MIGKPPAGAHAGGSTGEIRIDVAETTAAIALVDELRPLRPLVVPRNGLGWQVQVPSPADPETVLELVRNWLRSHDLAATTVAIDGRAQLVSADAA
jgi:hypothetical protein